VREVVNKAEKGNGMVWILLSLQPAGIGKWPATRSDVWANNKAKQGLWLKMHPRLRPSSIHRIWGGISKKYMQKRVKTYLFQAFFTLYF
jgi:hypothetical protein